MTTAAVTAAPSSPFCPSHKVTVVGAGNVGSSLAQRLLDHDLADVVLLDIVAGRPQGVALDLAQAQGMGQRHRHIIGSNDYADSAQSDVIVVTAGLPRRPGMGRDDLLQVNGKIVTETIRQALVYSPNAHIIVVTNPLDVMTYLAWKVSGLPPQRVMGMGGVLDSARFQTFVAWELGVPPGDVSALVLGGHGDLMVPLPAYTTVSGVPVTEFLPADRLATLMERTRQGGAEIVQLLKQGGAYYAPGMATYVMIEAILQGQSRLLPVAAHLDGQYGLEDLYLGVPCRLGRGGVESVIELALSSAEREALQRSAERVKQNVNTALSLLLE